MSELKNIQRFVPDVILAENPNLINFLKVIQGLQDIKEEEIERYVRSFYFPLLTDIRTMRKYVDDWEGEYTETSTKLCISCLYNNFYRIYSGKGTKAGLIVLLKCLFTIDEEPSVAINNIVAGKPLILFDDDRAYDFLPEGQDLDEEVNYPLSPKWCPTLLDEGWEESKLHFTVTVRVNYTPDAIFIAFIKKVILLYIPMATENTVIVTLNII